MIKCNEVARYFRSSYINFCILEEKKINKIIDYIEEQIVWHSENGYVEYSFQPNYLNSKLEKFFNKENNCQKRVVEILKKSGYKCVEHVKSGGVSISYIDIKGWN